MRTLILTTLLALAVAGCEKTIKEVRTTPAADPVALAPTR
jgi:hypothetical protein